MKEKLDKIIKKVEDKKVKIKEKEEENKNLVIQLQELKMKYEKVPNKNNEIDGDEQYENGEEDEIENDE